LKPAALVFDAVELGGRVALLAAATGRGGNGVAVAGDGGGWAELAEGVGFEGLSGKVEIDALGNRKGMDVSFWLVESITADGVSYVSGVEAARYHAASGMVQLLRDIEWPAPLSGTTAYPPRLLTPAGGQDPPRPPPSPPTEAGNAREGRSGGGASDPGRNNRNDDDDDDEGIRGGGSTSTKTSWRGLVTGLISPGFGGILLGLAGAASVAVTLKRAASP
ncbi:unnamed protein product, partial [Scytosiphon promiscuus]